MLSRVLEREWFGQFWEKIGNALLKRPGRIWIISFACMTPFAVIAYLCQDKLSYGLLSELPKNDSSVIGTAAVQAHFPRGIVGPITILVEDPDADFRTDADNDDKKPGWEQIRTFCDTMYDHREELGISDIRSIAYPLGMTERAKMDPFQRRIVLKRAQSQYVSDNPGWVGRVAKVEVVMKDDPFSPNSMTAFDHLKQIVPSFLNGDRDNHDQAASAHDQTPKLDPDKTQLHYMGVAPSMRDLKTLTGEDQVRIDFLVPAVVFLILVILLRQIATSAYLIFTVFFSYFVTLGVTFVVFYCIHWHGFAGIDWKVPIFLFTILVAVGEDYNILLMARIEEEQKTHGPVAGRDCRPPQNGRHHLQLRHHHGGHLLGPRRRYLGRSGAARICPGLRRAARHICRASHRRPRVPDSAASGLVRCAGPLLGSGAHCVHRAAACRCRERLRAACN